MGTETWRWAAPDGQQWKVQLDELRAGLSSGAIAPNAPIWKPGWKEWRPATDVPELTTSALGAANGVVLNVPPPPLAVVAVQHELESKGKKSFRPPPLEQPESLDEPPPPPTYIPAPTKVPFASEGVTVPTVLGLPPSPDAAALAAKRGVASGRVPSKPPPPLPGARAAVAVDSDESIEELSGSVLIDDASRGRLPISEPSFGALPRSSETAEGERFDPLGLASAPAFARSSPLARLETLLAQLKTQLAQLKKDIAAIRAGRPPENKKLLFIAGGVVGGTALLLIALLVGFASGGGEDARPSGSSSAAVSAAPPPTASQAPKVAPTETPADSAPVTTPPETARSNVELGSAVLGDCTMGGEAKSIGWRAIVPSGLEVAAVPSGLAVGFASNPREGVVVALEPTSLAATATVKGRALGGDARRVMPVLVQGKLLAAVDVDRGGDKLRSRRTVATSTPIDVGVADEEIVWAPHGKDNWAKLFALEGEGPVEALRAIPLVATKGVAVVFRRGGAVWLGVARGEGMLEPQGGLRKIEGLGQVGAPSVASTGDALVVAWADRVGPEDAWSIRWTKAPVAGAPAPPRTLALPAGGLGEQAMSPSVFGLGGGRFLVAWTEGPVSNHQVRAQTLGADGAPSGGALPISPAGLNAGQPQLAVGSDGKGVVAFLAAKGKGYEVHAASVSCPPR